MKFKRAALLMAITGMVTGGAAAAGDNFVSDAVFHPDNGQKVAQAGAYAFSDLPSDVAQVGCFDSSGCDESCDTMSCDGGCDAVCCDGGCDGACGGGGDEGACLFDCSLDDPFTLFGEVNGFSIGGWTQLGYHNKANALFNSRPGEYQLHQMWLYAEKALDTSDGFDWGARIDYVFGTDGPDTQAFGIGNDHWDAGWTQGDGDYGHAIPQLYGEVGYGDVSVKYGHFYTIIGWEVVGAPDNFFYSHAYTMYNSEPFTHTGTLATATVSDELEVYGGYVFGWDSGFEDNGDAFLGGASLTLCDDINVIYATVLGRFAEDLNGTVEQGYMHSIVTDVAVTDQLQYISQSDLLKTEAEDGSTYRDTLGLNNYLIYTASDCLAFGARFEWWQISGDSAGYYGDTVNLGLAPNFDPASDNINVYALTLGVNFKPHANVLVRPEVRWDWVSETDALAAIDNTLLEDNEDSQTTFGIDTIFLF